MCAWFEFSFGSWFIDPTPIAQLVSRTLFDRAFWGPGVELWLFRPFAGDWQTGCMHGRSVSSTECWLGGFRFFCCRLYFLFHSVYVVCQTISVRCSTFRQPLNGTVLYRQWGFSEMITYMNSTAVKSEARSQKFTSILITCTDCLYTGITDHTTDRAHLTHVFNLLKFALNPEEREGDALDNFLEVWDRPTLYLLDRDWLIDISWWVGCDMCFCVQSSERCLSSFVLCALDAVLQMRWWTKPSR